MKKYIVLTVIIIALITAVIINIKTSKKLEISQPPKQPENISIGVEVVKESTSAPKTQTMDQIPIQYAQITGCTKTINDIILDYGKTWGISKTAKVKA
ncbi:MAG: hypothetical protein AB1602_03190, partial [Elusimicrobiota bacterium]